MLVRSLTDWLTDKRFLSSVEDPQTFSGSSDLLVESSDDSAGGIVLIKSMWEFLASRLQLLPQGKAMKHDSILVGDKEKNGHI